MPASTTTATPTKPSPADRLLTAATELFAAHGIRAVGIDRIIGEAGVARASLYSGFGSKDALVTEYLHQLDLRDRQRWEDAVAGLDSPVGRIFAFFDLAIASAPVRNYRGCQYLNAATEFPGELHGVLSPVSEHRVWLHEQLTALLTTAKIPDAPVLATKIQTIYDGALAGSKFACSEEPIRVGRGMVADLLADAR
nr:TetR/AcrR family transcriptional regulator [Tomitella biformata]